MTDVLDLPVRLVEDARVLGHVVATDGLAGLGGTRLAPDGIVSGGLAAEGEADDEFVVAEVRLDVAARVVQEHRGLAPGARVRGLAVDVGGPVGPGPREELDGRGGPFDGVDASLGTGPGVLVGGDADAALVVAREGVTVGLGDEGGLAFVRDDAGAVHRGVVGVGDWVVGRLLVPALVEVKLAHEGPGITEGPESRPGTAGGLGQVAEAGNHKALVVDALALDPDAVTANAGPRGDVVGVDANPHLIANLPDETEPLGITSISVVDVARGGIDGIIVGITVIAFEEVPLVKEVGLVIGLVQVELGACRIRNKGQEGGAQSKESGSHGLGWERRVLKEGHERICSGLM